MATNHYFNHYGTNTADQRLVENLIIESIQTYGIDVYYLPRTLNDEDTIYGEDNTASYNSAHMVEMYIKNVDGFEGEGDFIAKFGIQIKDQITFSVSRRRWTELQVPGEGRNAAPQEGDLIYFPLTGALFQVMFVEDESVFYQTGSLQTFDVLCEMFISSDYNMNTGIDVLDSIERGSSYSVDFTMGAGSGTYTVGEQVYQGATLATATVKGEVVSWSSTDKVLRLMNMTGNFSASSNIIGDSSEASYAITTFDAQTSATDTQAQNAAIEQEADSIIDFTEGNPFGSL